MQRFPREYETPWNLEHKLLYNSYRAGMATEQEDNDAQTVLGTPCHKVKFDKMYDLHCRETKAKQKDDCSQTAHLAKTEFEKVYDSHCRQMAAHTQIGTVKSQGRLQNRRNRGRKQEQEIPLTINQSEGPSAIVASIKSGVAKATYKTAKLAQKTAEFTAHTVGKVATVTGNTMAKAAGATKNAANAVEKRAHNMFQTRGSTGSQSDAEKPVNNDSL